MNRRAFLALVPAVCVVPALLAAMPAHGASDTLNGGGTPVVNPPTPAYPVPRRASVDFDGFIPVRVSRHGDHIDYCTAYDLDHDAITVYMRDRAGDFSPMLETLFGGVAVEWDHAQIAKMGADERAYWQTRGAPV